MVRNLLELKISVLDNSLFQVRSVIRRHSNVCKISFIAHSLGGLIARYAIARLYEREPVKDISQQNGDGTNDNFKESSTREKFKGKIAGLEPMNFITSATPHLGSSGHKQVIHFYLSCWLI